MMNNKLPVMVTVQCLVYNHEPYLRECLDGFLMQKTNFTFEVFVHDDCSTDRSADIIREYEAKYPDIIKPVYEAENQYSKQDGSLRRILKEHTRGKYVALCEGDDYWTDPDKLQREVDFLETHQDYVAVAENGMVHSTISHKDYLFNSQEEHDVTIGELIKSRRFPTASVVYLNEAEGAYSDTVVYSHDTALWCWLCTKGKFRYRPYVSSVYRRGPQGVTESTAPYQWARQVECWNKERIKWFHDYYDTAISYQAIFNNYYIAFIKYIEQKKYGKEAWFCLRKCLSLSFFKTIKMALFSLLYQLFPFLKGK